MIQLELAKRKAAIRLRHLQKRKALGDLFKALKQEGVCTEEVVLLGV
jgi:uncharacterized protein (UPF0128 family)